MTGDRRGSGDWARYWRSGGPATGASGPIEAMHAHFRSHVYHRHSHETYSFGVTDEGAQAFTCRGGHHVSAAGMVMLFNPDDPHDGHAATGPGFTYRMIHIAPGQVESLLGDAGVRAGRRPLFRAPSSLTRPWPAVSAGSTPRSPPRRPHPSSATSTSHQRCSCLPATPRPPPSPRRVTRSRRRPA